MAVQKNNTLVSIIIAHHNRPEMLTELIDSIPNIPGIEIIVVDDHSRSSLQSPSLERAIVLNLPEGLRFAGAARNYGLDHASGEWIIFADSDDRFDADSFTSLSKALKTCSADILYFGVSSFRMDGIKGSRHKRYQSIINDVRSGKFESGCRFYPPWGKAIRKELIYNANARFDTTRVSNDVLFSTTTFLAARTLDTFDSTVYLVREGHASLVTQQTASDIAVRVQVILRHNALLRSSGLSEYQVPVINQIRHIVVRSPYLSMKLFIDAKRSGSPLFLCRSQLQKLFFKLRVTRKSA